MHVFKNKLIHNLFLIYNIHLIQFMNLFRIIFFIKFKQAKGRVSK